MEKRVKKKYYAMVAEKIVTSVRMSSDAKVNALILLEVFNENASEKLIDRAGNRLAKAWGYLRLLEIDQDIRDEFGDAKEPLWVYPDTYLTKYHKIITLNKNAFENEKLEFMCFKRNSQ